MPHFDRKDLPAGMPEEIAARYERQAMLGEDMVNRITSLIRNLNPDDLYVLAVMVSHMTDKDTGHLSAQRYEGWIDAAQEFIHGRCHICGEDHAKDLLDPTRPHDKSAYPAPATEPQPFPGDWVMPTTDDGEMIQDPNDLPDPRQGMTTLERMRYGIPESEIDRDYKYPDGVEPFLSKTDTELMERYFLDDAWSEVEDGIRFVGFACTGTGEFTKACGAIYPSIEDRMRRAPDHCSMCIQKQKWG